MNSDLRGFVLVAPVPAGAVSKPAKASTANKMMTTLSEIVQHIIQAHKENKSINLTSIKHQYAGKNGLTQTPKTVDIIAAIPEQWKKHILPKIKAKPVRTASGICVVAVMSKPHRCPHIAMTGNVCVYCPGGPDSDFEYSTQSYTGYEPTSMRAIRARYNPYLQVRNHLHGVIFYLSL